MVYFGTVASRYSSARGGVLGSSSGSSIRGCTLGSRVQGKSSLGSILQDLAAASHTIIVIFYIQEADYVKEAETDDQLSDGALDAHLPFVNPIAKLALAQDAEGNIKVLTLLCRFLGEHHF